MIKKINNKFENWYSNFFKDTKNIKNLLFYLGLICTLIIFTTGSSQIIQLDSVLIMNIQILTQVFLILKIILTKEKLSNYLFFTLIIVLTYICDSNMGNHFELTPVILLIIASRQVESSKIIDFVLCFNILLIGYHVAVYILDYVFNCGFFDLSYQTSFYRGEKIRHAFYFYHPNTFSNYLFWTYLMYVYLNFNNKKKTLLIVFIGIILAILTYIFPNSRNASLFYLISLILYALFKNKKFTSSKKICSLLSFSFVICFFVSFYLLIFMDSNTAVGNFINKFNLFLNNRLLVGYRYLMVYGISLLGNLFTPENNLLAVGYSRVILDNWYYYLIIRVGVIMNLFYLYSFSKTLTKSLQKKDYSKVFAIVIFLLYNCIESIGINPQISFPFFFLGMFL